MQCDQPYAEEECPECYRPRGESDRSGGEGVRGGESRMRDESETHSSTGTEFRFAHGAGNADESCVQSSPSE